MSISQDKKAVVIDKQGLEYICSCIKLLQSVPELLNDLTPSQKTVYSSYKVTELINALGENLQTYVNTSLGALNNLKKEIVKTVPSVDTAEENTIYLLKNDGDGGYSQYLLINGVVENLGSTTAINNVYTKTETDAKFALLSTLNDLIATVGGLNELKTNTKESIVKAINELNDRNYLEVIEITAKSVLDYAKTFDILTHTYFYANNCVDLPNNEHYGYCSVEVSQDPFYRDITFYSPTDGRIYVNTIGANADGSDFGTWSGWHKHLTNNDIVDTINSSSTDNQIPSALAVKTELDKKIDKSSIVSVLDSTVTNNQLVDGKTLVDKFNSIEDNFSRRYNFDDKKYKSTVDRKLAIKAVIATFKKDGASTTSIDYYEKNSVFIIRYNGGYYFTYIMTSYFSKVFILEYSPYSDDMIIWVEDETGELYIRGTIPITNDVIRIVNPFTTNKDKYKLYEGKYTIDENTKTCTLTVSIDCLSPASVATDVGSLNTLNLKIPSTPRTVDLKAEDDSTNIMRFYLGSSVCQVWLGTAGKRYTGTVTYTIK